MKTIQVKTDDSIIEKLKNAFTSPGTVLSEAMQNARRAGASFVRFRYLDEDAISIEDDGEGIAEMGDFLTLAGSGWDKDVVEREGAFGMGSFSMLYYCERIIVESNGVGFDAFTADILKHKPVALFDSTVTSGTKIQLFGYEISDENNASRIEHELRRLAMAFPISVFYDEEELEQPHRLDDSSKNYISTPVGEIFVAEYELDTESLSDSSYPERHGCDYSQLYYQGLPIGSTTQYFTKNIVHVSEQKFQVRMPDRDVFVSHEDATAAISSEIKSLWHKKLDEIRAVIGDEAFAGCMAVTAWKWSYKSIFNDMDVLPTDIVFQIVDKPVMGSTNHRDDYIQKCKGLVRSKLEQPGVTIIKIPDDYSSEEMKVEQYAHFMGALCVDSKSLSFLDKSHWLMKLVREVDENEILIESYGNRDEGSFTGCNSWFTYHPCEYYHVSGPLGSFDVRDQCFAVAAETLLVPSEALRGKDLLLVADYSDNWGGYDGNAADEDVVRFEALLALLNTSREQGLMNMIRRAGLNQVGVNNKQLVVTFDEDGFPCELKELDSSEAA